VSIWPPFDTMLATRRPGRLDNHYTVFQPLKQIARRGVYAGTKPTRTPHCWIADLKLDHRSRICSMMLARQERTANFKLALTTLL
jgi:hypothetical protein